MLIIKFQLHDALCITFASDHATCRLFFTGIKWLSFSCAVQCIYVFVFYASVSCYQITDACSACFEQRTVFTQQVLAKALNQMVCEYHI